MRYLLLIVLLIPFAATAERMLLAECEIAAGDKYFEAGTRLIMVFAIESTSESIWLLRDGEMEWYGSDSIGTPFEVNGGVWSITLASDVRKSLRNLDFRFVEGSLPLETSELSDDPIDCPMDYSQIEYYESGDWVEDDEEESKN